MYKHHVTSWLTKVRDLMEDIKHKSIREKAGLGYVLALKPLELWLASCRPVVKGDGYFRSLCKEGRPAIIALWHSGLIYTLFHFRKRPGAIMISPSSDGEWVAKAVAAWGQIPVRGSRHKGGLQAIRTLSEIIKKRGVNAGIVADGSRGPAMKAQKGAVVLARLTGVPIIPTGFAARSAIYFNSWDKMVLPYPGSRVSMVYGEPMFIEPGTRGMMIEKARQDLEKRLNDASRSARLVLGL